MLVELILLIATVLITGYAAVFILILKYGSRMPTVRKNDDFSPFVSIVIPTMNEEEIIEKRLQNLIQMDYPKENLEVIFVDRSRDETAKIIETYQKEHPFIRLLKQEKLGFNNALNQGYSAAKGEIIVKSDCTAFPYPDALRKLISNFEDSSIGAVCGIHVFSKDGKSLEKEFKNIQYKVQQMEAYLHSSLVSHGALGAYRRNLVPKLREELTSDDSEVIVSVVKKGYRAIIDPKVKSIEQEVKTFRDRRKEKNRRAAGVMRVILSNLNMFFRKRYGAFAFITLPVDFFILILSPVLVSLLFVLLTYYAVTNLSTSYIFVLPIFSLALISLKYSIKIRAIFDTYLSCLMGLFQAFTKKKTWR